MKKRFEGYLEELGHRPTYYLERQDLDFKEWNTRSLKDAVALVVEMAICRQAPATQYFQVAGQAERARHE